MDSQGVGAIPELVIILSITLKQGEVPAEWQERPHKLAQKDVVSRWTKKNGTSHYGYKNHVSDRL